MKQHPGEIEIASYDYPLNEDRIAKYPLEQRDLSKLLIYKEDEIRESVFKNIGQELPENALLLFNETKVIQARLQCGASTRRAPFNVIVKGSCVTSIFVI